MKVKEIIKHLSKIPEDLEVDSINFKDNKTKLQVLFDFDSLRDNHYDEIREYSEEQEEEQEEDGANYLDKTRFENIKKRALEDIRVIENGDNIDVYDSQFRFVGNFTFR